MKIRKIMAGIGIAILSLIAFILISAGAVYLIAVNKASVRFLLSNSGFLTPKNYIKQETIIDVRGTRVPVMTYRNPRVKTNKYFMLQHGLTPDGYQHPKIDRFAKSLCDATGMTVLIPYVKGSVEGGSLKATYDTMANIYIELVKKFPGKYRAFGACIGANILLVALNRVPAEIYPEKIFMLGPFSQGRTLFDFFNKLSNPEDVDIMVKMAVTLNMEVYSDAEKNLIRKAIAASKPGTTDRSEMKKILGEKLFHDITVIKLRHKDFEEISPRTMFRENNRPKCKYFILHSKNDNIIPYFEGKNLALFMKNSGISTEFLGTEYLEHAQNQASVTGFIKEMKYLIRFFDELFEGDVEI